MKDTMWNNRLRSKKKKIEPPFAEGLEKGWRKPVKSDRSKLIARLDRVFSEYIRIRDSFKTQSGFYFKCISCGKIKPYEDADCGHYVNRGHMGTRFSEDNCHAQCRNCNRFDEGNIYNYRRSLVDKIGESRVLLLESRKHDVCKLSEFELKVMIEDYKKKLKALKEERGWKK